MVTVVFVALLQQNIFRFCFYKFHGLKRALGLVGIFVTYRLRITRYAAGRACATAPTLS
jgi:hypothetical protein